MKRFTSGIVLGVFISALQIVAGTVGTTRALDGTSPYGTTLVSRTTTGGGTNDSSGPASVSDDGRYVAWSSWATNVVPNDTNGLLDVFVTDTLTDGVSRASVGVGGTEPNDAVSHMDLSGNGRFLAFSTLASNVVTADTNGNLDVFVRDLQTGVTTRISVTNAGEQSNESWAWWLTDIPYPSITADGSKVVFASEASNLVDGDTNNLADVFVRDLATGTTTRASQSSTGDQGNGRSESAVISDDGRYVAFHSQADNLVTGDTNNAFDIFVRDLVTGTTTRASVSSTGEQANAHSGYHNRTVLHPNAISRDGRRVAFTSRATNLVPDDTNGLQDVFVRDTVQGTTVRASVSSTGGQSSHESWIAHDSLSERAVALYTSAALVPEDANGTTFDVYLHDLRSRQTERISVSSAGGDPEYSSTTPSATPDGRFVAFSSSSATLVASDSNGSTGDIFLRERGKPITAPLPSLLGFWYEQTTTADPVDTASGNFVHREVDLESPPNVFGMSWTRTHNSRGNGPAGPLGPGWTTAFSDRVSLDLQGAAVLAKHDGRVVVFPSNGSGGFTRPFDEFATLARDANGQWSLQWFHGETWRFDAAGLLTTKTNWDGQTVSASRDAGGRLQSIVGAAGTRLDLAYTGATLSSVTTADGRSVSYSYDSSTGHLAGTTVPGGGLTSYTTDASGRVTSIVDATGVTVVANSYDEDGRVDTQSSGSGGSTTSFFYEPAIGKTLAKDSATGQVVVYRHTERGRVQIATDPAGRAIVNSFDSATGYLTGTQNRLGATTSKAFDSHGNVTRTTDAANVVRTATYDSSDRPLTVDDPAVGRSTFSYTGANRVPSSVTDAAGKSTTHEIVNGLVTKETDADGISTSYAYDSARRLQTVTVAPGTTLAATTSFTYDAAGRILTVTDALNGVTANTYDAAGRVLTTTDPGGATTTNTYDAAGRVLTTTDPVGATTTNTYDPSGRLLSTRSALGKVTTFAYDQLGRPETTTYSDGRTSSRSWGIFGRTTSTRDELGRSTSYGFDFDGNHVSTTHPGYGTDRNTVDTAGRATGTQDALNRQSSRTTYDVAGRLATSAELGGATTTYAYDSLGRVSQIIDPRGGVTVKQYTAAGRTKSVSAPNGVTVTLSYDAAGRLSSESTAAGATLHEYDAAGRETKTTSPGGLVVRRTYDGNGRVLTTTDPAGVVTTRTYTERGGLASEGRTGAGTIRYTYDLDGKLTSVIDANGHSTGFVYDDRGRLVSQTDATGQATRWGYDSAGQLTSQTDPLGNVSTTTYDANGRIATTADPSNRSVARTYDVAGQLTRLAYGDGSTVDFTFDSAGRRATMADASGTTNYSYDAAGALTRVAAPDGRVTAYTYDTAGRRTSVTAPDGSSLRYTYDAMSRLSAITPGEWLADTFTAANGSDPETAKWTRSTSAGGSGLVQGNAAALEVTDVSGSSVSLTATSPNVANPDMSLRYRFTDNGSGAKLHLRLRSSGGNSYWVELANNSSTVTVWKKAGTKTTQVGSVNGWLDTAQHALRFRVDGNRVRVRVWNPAQAEPASWALDKADSSVSSPGTFEMAWTRVSGAKTVIVDDVIYSDVAGRPSVAGYQYDADGRVTSENLVNGSRTWTYVNGRLTQLAQSLPGATGTTTFGYDSTGRIASESSGTATTSFGYDDASQLTSMSPVIGPATSYTYDSLGRRTRATTGSTTTAYSYDIAGRLTGTSGAENAAYAYDAAGRRISEVGASGTTTFDYDSAGRLGSYSNGTTTQRRGYNGEGRLVGVTNTSGATTSSTQLDWDVATSTPHLLGFAGATTTSLVRGPTGWAALRRGGSTSALALDGYGSVVPSEGSAGIARAGSYDAFGLAAGPATFDPRLGYRGELTLGSLVHLRAREYQPGTGSFLSLDPRDGVAGTPVIANPYHYGDNDPLRRVDPSGERPGTSAFVTGEDQFQFELIGSTEPTLSCGRSGVDYGSYRRQAKTFLGHPLCARGYLSGPGGCLDSGGWCHSARKDPKAEATGQSHAIRALGKMKWGFSDNLFGIGGWTEGVDWEVGPPGRSPRIDIVDREYEIYEVKYAHGSVAAAINEAAGQVTSRLNTRWGIDGASISFEPGLRLGGWAVWYCSDAGLLDLDLCGKRYYAWGVGDSPGVVVVSRDQDNKVPKAVKKRASRGDDPLLQLTSGPVPLPEWVETSTKVGLK